MLGVLRCGTRLSSKLRLLNISFAAVIHVVYTGFEADKSNMDALVGLRDKAGARRRRGNNSQRAFPGDAIMGNAIR